MTQIGKTAYGDKVHWAQHGAGGRCWSFCGCWLYKVHSASSEEITCKRCATALASEDEASA